MSSIIEELDIPGLVNDVALDLGSNALVDLVIITETAGNFNTAPVQAETAIADVPAAITQWKDSRVGSDSTPAYGLEVFIGTGKLGSNVPASRKCKVTYAGATVLVEKVIPVASGGSTVAGYTLICEGS